MRLINSIIDGEGTHVLVSARKSAFRTEYSNLRGSGGSASWDDEFGIDGGCNIDADPLFDDTDCHLGAESECIDRADDAAAPEVDKDGNHRVDIVGKPAGGCSGVADMGAYEYVQ
jgi:hypothetical protein